MPYLLDYRIEQRIYDAQIRARARLGKHVAPHVAWVTALWAVLTRMRKPLAEKYPKALSDLVAKLAPLEKAQLYADGVAPDGLSAEQQRELVAGIEKICARVGHLPELRGAHRRLAARDEDADHERGAEPASTRACRRSRSSTSWRSWCKA